MGILVWREDAEDVVVLVDGLAVVAHFLLVPPIGVGVAKLALEWKGRGEGGIGIAAILRVTGGGGVSL